MKKSVVLLLLLSIPVIVSAQRTVSRNNLVWFGDFTTAKVASRWSVYLDFGFRRTEWLNKWSQLLVRPGITFNVNEKISATIGVAYFSHYASNNIKPEYRGWQQLLFSETNGRVRWSHRLRTEQRTTQKMIAGKLVDDYSYTNRYRYQFGLQIALNRPKLADKTMYVLVAEEVFVNSGKEIRINYFDQNRISVGIGYKHNDLLNISISFMKDFIQKSQVDVFESNNVLVININHNFDFKKKGNQ